MTDADDGLSPPTVFCKPTGGKLRSVITTLYTPAPNSHHDSGPSTRQLLFSTPPLDLPLREGAFFEHTGFKLGTRLTLAGCPPAGGFLRLVCHFERARGLLRYHALCTPHRWSTPIERLVPRIVGDSGTSTYSLGVMPLLPHSSHFPACSKAAILGPWHAIFQFLARATAGDH